MKLYERIKNAMYNVTADDYKLSIKWLESARDELSGDFLVRLNSKSIVERTNELILNGLHDNYNPNKVTNIRSWLLDLSDEDVEWGKEHSRFMSPVFAKVSLKDEHRGHILGLINEALDRFRGDLDSVLKGDSHFGVSEWTRVKTYELRPQTKERSGYLDADYVNEENRIVRMVYTEIPDFCLYAVPKRLEYNEKVITRSSWTEDERSCSLWITRFERFE